jgi:hypothetical protein
MSLDSKNKGNPNWGPGKSGNPYGRPRGGTNKINLNKVEDRLLHKHKVHPTDQLVSIAQQARMNNDLELAAEIWMKLQSYCEPTKKPVEVPVEKPKAPSGSKEAAEATLKLLKELVDGQPHSESTTGGAEKTSNSDSMATGPTPVSTETSTEEDLRQHSQQ